MSSQDRALFHQLHPMKLAVDWLTAAATLVLFWRHELLVGLVVAFVPSVVLSVAMIKGWLDLTWLADSRAGRYLKWHMTKPVEAVRFGGFFLALAGAWWHHPVLIVVGTVVILAAWFAGLLPLRARKRIEL